MRHPDGRPITDTPFCNKLNFYDVRLEYAENLERRARLAEAQLALAVAALERAEELHEKDEHYSIINGVYTALREIRALEEGEKSE